MDADIVIPVPDSGNAAALGFSQESGIPLDYGFIRNHYVGRTFIMPEMAQRADSVDMKLAVVPGVVRDKRIVVVDDSIIRGTTSRRRVAALRKAGAKEIHLRISCPPTRASLLFRHRLSVARRIDRRPARIDEIAEFIGADSLAYLSLEGLLAGSRSSRRLLRRLLHAENTRWMFRRRRTKQARLGKATALSTSECRPSTWTLKRIDNRKNMSLSDDRAPAPQGLYHPALRTRRLRRGIHLQPARGAKSHDIVHKALRNSGQPLAPRRLRVRRENRRRRGHPDAVAARFSREQMRRARHQTARSPGVRRGAGLSAARPGAAQALRELFEDVVRAGRAATARLARCAGATTRCSATSRAKSKPVIRQVFIGRGQGHPGRGAISSGSSTSSARSWNARSANRTCPRSKFFYVPSLSCRTMIYKGLLLADQIEPFFPDLTDPAMASGLALVHQRYSTNTFPTWDLAQPFRFLCHNGEINTLRGNINWMNAREGLFESELFGDDIAEAVPDRRRRAPATRPFSTMPSSCSTTPGRSLPHAIMMLIPEAWQNHKTMSDEKKAFYEYHSCLMEPWDGPASIPFTDGTVHRRRARPQRPAALALHGDQGRLRHHGLRDRRARDRSGQRAVQGPASARPHVPGRHGAGPHRRRRGDQGGDRAAQPYRAWLTAKTWST